MEESQFDRAGMHDPSALCGEFQHLFIGDVVELASVPFNAGVRGEDAVDIGVDFGALGVNGGGQCHGGRVGSSAAQGREVGVGAHALEARDNDHVVALEFLPDAGSVDAGDASAVEGVVGVDAGLGAGEGDRRVAEFAQGEGEQRAADDFASGEQHVVFAA